MIRIVSALFLLILLSSCGSSIDVITDYDHEADFSAYKSFFFLPWNKENSKLVNEFDQKRIILAVTKELEARGYKRQESEGDLAVGLNLIIDKKTAQQAYTSYYSSGGWGYHSPYGFGVSTTHYNTYDYLVGTLIIDLFDAGQKKLVWQGAAVGTVDKDRADKQDRINSVIEQIFWEYPLDTVD